MKTVTHFGGTVTISTSSVGLAVYQNGSLAAQVIPHPATIHMNIGTGVAIEHETAAPPPPPPSPPTGNLIRHETGLPGRKEVQNVRPGELHTIRLDVPANAPVGQFYGVKLGEWGGGPGAVQGWMGTAPGADNVVGGRRSGRTSVEWPLSIGHNGAPGWNIRVEPGQTYWFTVPAAAGFFIEAYQFKG